jgi:membrane protease YdiL (CAAX protease family)
MSQWQGPLERTESAWRLIAAAVGWLLLAIACSFAAGNLVRLIGSLLHWPDALSFSVSSNVGAYVVEAVVLLAAVIRGRIVGQGNINAGLGSQPVSRLPLIAGLAVLAIAYAVLLRFVLHNSPLYRPTGNLSSVWAWVAVLVPALVLDPIAEESLFRGWLWTGLQKRWNVLSTALFTGAFWLALHALINPVAALALIPVAVMLAAARHFGQSIRASIALHVTYNLSTLSATLLLHP